MTYTYAIISKPSEVQWPAIKAANVAETRLDTCRQNQAGDRVIIKWLGSGPVLDGYTVDFQGSLIEIIEYLEENEESW